MRLKTTYTAVMLLAALFLAACNAVDSRVNTNNSNTASSSPSPETYSDGVRRITPAELEALMKEGKAFVVDVRSQDSFDIGHIPGSKLIPSTDILKHVNELPRDKTIVTYCSWAKEHTSAGAVAQLKTKGFQNAAALLGGFQTWQQEGRAVDKKK